MKRRILLLAAVPLLLTLFVEGHAQRRRGGG
jgi:hypothetical protein